MYNFSLVISMVMELVFAIVTGLIAFYSFKIYKIANQKEIRLFGIGFISIALSYATWIILNLCALYHISSPNLGDVLKAFNILTIGAYVHIILFLIGLAIISFVNLKNNNFEFLALLVILSLVPIVFGTNASLLFYIISIVFFAYLTEHYVIEYAKNKKNSSLRMLLSFLLLAIGTLMLVLSNKNYITGHIFSFVAYIILMINLIISLKHGKKAK